MYLIRLFVVFIRSTCSFLLTNKIWFLFTIINVCINFIFLRYYARLLKKIFIVLFILLFFVLFSLITYTSITNQLIF